MNPFRWKREHQVAFISICLVGALVGIAFGFAIWALAPGSTFRGLFVIWLERPVVFQWWPWPLLGAAIGGLSFYAVRLSRY